MGIEKRACIDWSGQPRRGRPTLDLVSCIGNITDTHSSSLALPAVRVRFPARWTCQGRTLRSRERKLRGLDSACGKALGTATKGICFFARSL